MIVEDFSIYYLPCLSSPFTNRSRVIKSIDIVNNFAFSVDEIILIIDKFLDVSSDALQAQFNIKQFLLYCWRPGPFFL